MDLQIMQMLLGKIEVVNSIYMALGFLLTPDPLAPVVNTSSAGAVSFNVMLIVEYILGIVAAGLMCLAVYKIFFDDSKSGIVLFVGGSLICGLAIILMEFVFQHS